MNSRIYSLHCKENGRVYIGSSRKFKQRKAEHIASLRGGYHQNIHLQRAWDKYGEKAFKWTSEECPEDRLMQMEQFYIDSFDWEDLFNINPNASRPPDRTGHSPSDLNRAINSKRMKENNPSFGGLSEEHKRKISESLTGIKMPESQIEATRERMSNNNPVNIPGMKEKLSKLKRKYSDEFYQQLVNDYNSGLSQQKVADKYGISRRGVRTALKWFNNK